MLITIIHLGRAFFSEKDTPQVSLTHHQDRVANITFNKRKKTDNSIISMFARTTNEKENLQFASQFILNLRESVFHESFYFLAVYKESSK